MKVAVLSDIHANLRALEAVLAAIDADPPDELWCLGDVVGYGPKPNECCALMAARVPRCLGGNHDLAVRERSTWPTSPATPASRPAGRARC